MDRGRLVNLLDPPKTKHGDYDKGGQAELSRRIGISQQTISYRLSPLMAEPETLKVAEEEWKKPKDQRKFSPFHLAEAKKLEDAELKKKLEEAIVEGKYKSGKEVREVVSFLKEPKIKKEEGGEVKEVKIDLTPKIKEMIVKKELTPKSVPFVELGERLAKAEDLISETEKQLLEGKKPVTAQLPKKEPVIPEEMTRSCELNKAP